MNASAPDTPPTGQPLRLFLVDDHALVRDGLRARLGSLPHLRIVGEAGSGDEALAAIESLAAAQQPDVVLTDVGMKDMNGLDLAAAMLQRWPGLRVLMLSMYDNPEYVQRAMQVGARGYVLKDAPAAEIIAALDAVAAGGTFLSPAVSHRLFRNQTPRPLLTPRESEILSALGRGQSSKQIASSLGLSVRTVEAHRQNIKRRLEIGSLAELIRYAVEHARTAGDDGQPPG